MRYIAYSVYVFIEIQMLYVCLTFWMLLTLVCGLSGFFLSSFYFLW